MDKKQLTELIGKNVCKYREQSGMTQAQLAEKIGVGTPYISRIESAVAGLSYASGDLGAEPSASI